MCGRFSVLSQPEELERYYDADFKAVYRGPSYNVAPTQSVPIITTGGEVISAKFGLIPFWAKDSKIGYKMINARAETIMDKNTYKSLVSGHRCLIPASGFYEWQKVGDKKQPYYFTVKDTKVFSFAGLYTSRKDSEGVESFTFTIITTEPNSLVAEIHDRMPVILTREEEKLWINPDVVEPDEVLPLLDAFPSAKMQKVPVSTDVNNVRNNSDELIKPINSK